MRAKLISFVIAGAARPKKAKEAVQSPIVKSAPHYFEAMVPQQFIINQNKLVIRGREGIITLKTYQPDALLAEARFELDDIFADEVFDIKEEAIASCHELLKKSGAKDEDRYSEEYSLYVVADYLGDPEQFLKNKERIASLLKSEKLALDPLEIDYTLSSQLKYSKNDLVIIDWDGAFLFDPIGEEADIDPVVELIQLANLQLLRYRMLDSNLDAHLKRMAKLMQGYPAAKPFFLKNKELTNAFREVIAIRSKSLAEFDALDRDIKLIGEWYSARLYDLALKKFKMDEWKRTVKDKLESLEDEYTIISENFSVSRTQFLEVVQIILFFILQLGWFVLIILEFGEFLK